MSGSQDLRAVVTGGGQSPEAIRAMIDVELYRPRGGGKS